MSNLLGGARLALAANDRAAVLDAAGAGATMRPDEARVDMMAAAGLTA